MIPKLEVFRLIWRHGHKKLTNWTIWKENQEADLETGTGEIRKALHQQEIQGEVVLENAEGVGQGQDQETREEGEVQVLIRNLLETGPGIEDTVN